jgi:hypothetical protein
MTGAVILTLGAAIVFLSHSHPRVQWRAPTAVLGLIGIVTGVARFAGAL